jgi:hypothetical protein
MSSPSALFIEDLRRFRDAAGRRKDFQSVLQCPEEKHFARRKFWSTSNTAQRRRN